MQLKRFGTLLTRDFAPPVAGIHRILVIKLDHFGDFIIGLPAFERLRQTFPDAHITLICGSWNCGLAESTALFDVVHGFDHFPQVAKSWDGVPLEPPERFEALTTGYYDLALDLRVDADTRFLLQRVDAGLRGGIGDAATFPFLDITLPVGHQPWILDPQTPTPLLTVPPDAFVSRMPGRDGAEQVNNFSVTNTCLLNSPQVSLPLARCRVTFAVGLTGLGFARLRARMSFDVLQNGQMIAERIFVGHEMGILAGGHVSVDFDSDAEGSRFEFRVHAARRPIYGRFTFRGIRIEAIESLMHPRWQPSQLHVGEKLSLLVALAHERTRDLYGDRLQTSSRTPLPPEIDGLLDGPGAEGGLIVIAPLSNSSVRDWPMQNYIELVSLLLDLRDCRIALVGTADQAERLDALRRRHESSGRVVSLAGRTAWSAMPALLRRASLVICNNSGIAHLAAAGGVRTLAIYSASHQSREWGPRGRLSRAIMAEVACSPCGHEAVEACPFGHTCMKRITPDFVCSQALEMLGAIVAMPAEVQPVWQHGG